VWLEHAQVKIDEDEVFSSHGTKRNGVYGCSSFIIKALEYGAGRVQTDPL
jgi:hypothetical protein